MEQFIVKSLDSTLERDEVQIDETRIIMEIESTRDVMECPYCGEKSGKIHSKYQRRMRDLPVQNTQVMLVLNTREIFCQNNQLAEWAHRVDACRKSGQKVSEWCSEQVSRCPRTTAGSEKCIKR